MSIQFGKKNHYLSIKNRYNHWVNNFDAPFSNNFNNIYPGLAYAFKICYGLDSKNSLDFELISYVMASDNKFYKYVKEINNVHYCTNNIIIETIWSDKFVKRYEKEKYIIMDYYILDLENKLNFSGLVKKCFL